MDPPLPTAFPTTITHYKTNHRPIRPKHRAKLGVHGQVVGLQSTASGELGVQEWSSGHEIFDRASAGLLLRCEIS